MAPESNIEDREDMTEWASEIQREVYHHWKENYSDYDPGVKVFYSPVYRNPHLLILGYQPGGSEFGDLHEKFEAGRFSPPAEHEYLTESWDLTRPVRNKLFRDATHHIEDSVALNLLFYKSPSISEWKALEESKRNEIESFCISHTTTIVEELSPENVLIIGWETWDELTEVFGFETERTVERNGYRGNDLVRISDSSSPQYIGIRHVSDRHSPSDDEYEKARQAILPVLE